MKLSKLSKLMVIVTVVTALFVAVGLCGCSGDGSTPNAPAADTPAVDQPAADQPANDEPAATDPSANEPAADTPATDTPANDGTTSDANFSVENTEDGVIVVKADEAAAESSGVGYVTLAKGQTLLMSTELATGQVSFAVRDENSVEPTEAIGQFAALAEEPGEQTLDIPAGEYSILATATEGTTGEVTLTVQ